MEHRFLFTPSVDFGGFEGMKSWPWHFPTAPEALKSTEFMKSAAANRQVQVRCCATPLRDAREMVGFKPFPGKMER